MIDNCQLLFLITESGGPMDGLLNRLWHKMTVIISRICWLHFSTVGSGHTSLSLSMSMAQTFLPQLTLLNKLQLILHNYYNSGILYHTLHWINKLTHFFLIKSKLVLGGGWICNWSPWQTRTDYAELPPKMN